MLCSVPAQVDASQCVELFVVWSVEVTQSLQRLVINCWVKSTFRLTKAAHSLIDCSWPSQQTRKTFSGVEIEVSLSDERSELQERLNVQHLTCGVADEPLAVYEVYLTTWKHVEPATHMLVVETDVDSWPRRVDDMTIIVFERTTLERRPSFGVSQVAVSSSTFGLCLRKVGQRSSDWVTHDYQQSDVTRHVVNALRHVSRHEIVRCLLQRQLTTWRQRHSRPDAQTQTHWTAKLAPWPTAWQT